jgi:hypothetical protein
MGGSLALGEVGLTVRTADRFPILRFYPRLGVSLSNCGSFIRLWDRAAERAPQTLVDDAQVISGVLGREGLLHPVHVVDGVAHEVSVRAITSYVASLLGNGAGLDGSFPRESCEDKKADEMVECAHDCCCCAQVIRRKIGRKERWIS